MVTQVIRAIKVGSSNKSRESIILGCEDVAHFEPNARR